jgi:hypothetical protein
MPKEVKSKWSATEIKDHTKKILDLVAKQKKENKLQNFTGITEEEIAGKFTRINSPMIVWQSWSSSTTPGGNINYTVGIYNPDPTTASNLFAHVWLGSGNVDPVTGTFLSNVDTRFPRLTQPAVFGLSLAPSASSSLSFVLKVPSTVEKTNYLGNTCLMQFNWHDTGLYLDRGIFVFAVV